MLFSRLFYTQNPGAKGWKLRPRLAPPLSLASHSFGQFRPVLRPRTASHDDSVGECESTRTQNTQRQHVFVSCGGAWMSARKRSRFRSAHEQAGRRYRWPRLQGKIAKWSRSCPPAHEHQSSVSGHCGSWTAHARAPSCAFLRPTCVPACIPVYCSVPRQNGKFPDPLLRSPRICTREG